MTDQPKNNESFEQASLDHKDGSLIGEFFAFMKDNAKWWLLPIIIVLGLLGAVLIFSGGAVAPFIYTLF